MDRPALTRFCGALGALCGVVGPVGCGDGGRGSLSQANAHLSVAPGALAFTAYVGAAATQAVTLGNSGAGGDTVTLTLDGGPWFQLGGTPTVAVGAGGSMAVLVNFAPGDAGNSTALLSVTGATGTLEVALAGVALPPLPCPASGPCDAASFDADAGRCAHAVLPDGTACPSPSSCLSDARCQAGTCVGTPTNCDDGDACTADSCVEGTGCVHADSSARCLGGAPCQSYGCDPATGCTQASAGDGTLCSLENTCQTAEVCVAGSCVGVAVPDGVPCQLWWEPCAADSACRGGTCRSPTAEAEAPGTLRFDAGLTSAEGPFAVDDGGESFFTADVPGAASALLSLDACGRQRWVATEGRFEGVLLDGEQAIAWTDDGRVLGLSAGSGAQLWSLDVGAALQLCGDGGACLHGGEDDFLAPALSSEGLLYIPVSGALRGTTRASVPSSLLGAYRNGQVAFRATLPWLALWSVSTDAAGNAYVSFFDVQAGFGVAAFDAQGQQLFAESVPAFASGLAVGRDFLFVTGSATELALDGGGTLDALALSSAPCLDTGATTDGEGRLFAIGSAASEGSYGPFGLVAFGADGGELWQLASASRGEQLNLSSPLLADDGTLYALHGPPCGDEHAPHGGSLGVVAVDSDAGALLWDTRLPSPTNDSTRLALTPHATLLFSGAEGIYGVFAGKVRPATSAPWPRAQGADNSNRSSAAAVP